MRWRWSCWAERRGTGSSAPARRTRQPCLAPSAALSPPHTPSLRPTVCRMLERRDRTTLSGTCAARRRSRRTSARCGGPTSPPVSSRGRLPPAGWTRLGRCLPTRLCHGGCCTVIRTRTTCCSTSRPRRRRWWTGRTAASALSLSTLPALRRAAASPPPTTPPPPTSSRLRPPSTPPPSARCWLATRPPGAGSGRLRRRRWWTSPSATHWRAPSTASTSSTQSTRMPRRKRSGPTGRCTRSAWRWRCRRSRRRCGRLRAPPSANIGQSPNLKRGRLRAPSSAEDCESRRISESTRSGRLRLRKSSSSGATGPDI
mmetsp:Transcript_23837/g.70565  ORF Transcript_23837/g.70565 Transcript_23837/m.70565 type:complete len:314 (+) Transcript_23837:390-1331(+)